jgi:ABC-type Zn2+ transport system substrate-binding protein/surface adhesin
MNLDNNFKLFSILILGFMILCYFNSNNKKKITGGDTAADNNLKSGDGKEQGQDQGDDGYDGGDDYGDEEGDVDDEEDEEDEEDGAADKVAVDKVAADKVAADKVAVDKVAADKVTQKVQQLIDSESCGVDRDILTQIEKELEKCPKVTFKGGYNYHNNYAKY